MKVLAAVIALIALTLHDASAASGSWTAEGVATPAALTIAAARGPRRTTMLVGVAAFRGAIVYPDGSAGSTDPAVRLVTCNKTCRSRTMSVSALDVDAEGTITATGSVASFGATSLVWRRAGDRKAGAGFCSSATSSGLSIAMGYRFATSGGYPTTLTGRIGSWRITGVACSVATMAERVSLGLSWS